MVKALQGARHADPPVHHPLLRHWQLVLKYFRVLTSILEYSLRYSDEYSNRKLLVSGSPSKDGNLNAYICYFPFVRTEIYS